jgi:hypothetical protein
MLMTDPIAFDSTTPRYRLPLLFAGQAQKELTVNEANARIDALLHAEIAGAANEPPAAPDEGETWLVEAGVGAWADHAGALATYVGGSWLFAKPRAGLRVYDKSTQATRFYSGVAWQMPASPAEPQGGTTVDVEARNAIAAMYGILATVGLIPPQ